MPDIMVLFACLSQCLDRTTIRQLHRVVEAMLAMTGRVTMRGMARWADKGGKSCTTRRADGLMKAPKGGQHHHDMKGPQGPERPHERASRPSRPPMKGSKDPSAAALPGASPPALGCGYILG